MARTPKKTHSLVRLETFTDAVIAVAMTVMVLDLKAPQVSSAVRSHRFDFSFLHQVAPKLVAYTVSFFYVGMDWIALVTRFRRATRATWPLLWLTLVHVFCVCLVPWAAAFIAENPTLPQAVAIYGASCVLVTATASFVLRHLEVLFPETGAWEFRKNMAVTALGGAGCVAAFVTIYLAFVLFALCTVPYYLPARWQERIFRSAFSPPRAGDDKGPSS